MWWKCEILDQLSVILLLANFAVVRATEKDDLAKHEETMQVLDLVTGRDELSQASPGANVVTVVSPMTNSDYRRCIGTVTVIL